MKEKYCWLDTANGVGSTTNGPLPDLRSGHDGILSASACLVGCPHIACAELQQTYSSNSASYYGYTSSDILYTHTQTTDARSDRAHQTDHSVQFRLKSCECRYRQAGCWRPRPFESSIQPARTVRFTMLPSICLPYSSAAWQELTIHRPARDPP